MARAMWTGTIGFGLVSVPVKLYPAAREKTVRFNQLCSEHSARVRQQLICTAEGEAVERAGTVKGYEVGPDRYVTVTDADLTALAPQSSRALTIDAFVPAGSAPPNAYSKSYWAGPADGAAGAYGLLHAAMREHEVAAAGVLMLRSREQPVLLEAVPQGLLASVLHYADELVPAEEITGMHDAIAAAQDGRQHEMAGMLISQMQGPFEYAWQDHFREQVLALIDAKAAGEEIAVAPPAPAAQAVPDLMAALEASVKAAKAGRPKPAAKRTAPGKAPARKPKASSKS